MKIEQLRQILAGYDEGIYTETETEVKVTAAVISEFFDALEQGKSLASFSSCCCRVEHPLAKEISCRVVSGAHLFAILPAGAKGFWED